MGAREQTHSQQQSSTESESHVIQAVFLRRLIIVRVCRTWFALTSTFARELFTANGTWKTSVRLLPIIAQLVVNYLYLESALSRSFMLPPLAPPASLPNKTAGPDGIIIAWITPQPLPYQRSSSPNCSP